MAAAAVLAVAVVLTLATSAGLTQGLPLATIPEIECGSDVGAGDPITLRVVNGVTNVPTVADGSSFLTVHTRIYEYAGTSSMLAPTITMTPGVLCEVRFWMRANLRPAKQISTNRIPCN